MQLRETIEFTILQLFEVYFNVAQLTESNVIFKENLESIFGKRKWLTAEEKLQASLNEEAEIDTSPKKKTAKNTDKNRDSELISDEQQEND